MATQQALDDTEFMKILNAELGKQSAIRAQQKQQQIMNHYAGQPGQYINGGSTGSYTSTGSSLTVKKPNHGFKTTKDDGKVDWAKFAMWLRGFLAGIEGQPLTPESVGKIMDKLATVDPDRNLSYMKELDDLFANIPVYPQSPPQISHYQYPNTYPNSGGWTAQTPDPNSWLTMIYNANLPNVTVTAKCDADSKLAACASSIIAAS